jgi:hypothetical protein
MPEPSWSTIWVEKKNICIRTTQDKSGKAITAGDDDQGEGENEVTDFMRTLHPFAAGSARSPWDKLLPGLCDSSDDLCDKD